MRTGAVRTLLAAAAATLVTATATAAPPPRGQLVEAKRIAAETSGHPCPRVRIRFRDLPGRTIGRAYRRGRRCRIVLDRNVRWWWGKLCTVVAHEWRHLAGHGHTTRRGSLMFPVYHRPFWRCRHAGR